MSDSSGTSALDSSSETQDITMAKYLLLAIVMALLMETLNPVACYRYSTLALGTCKPSGQLRGKEGNCNPEHDSDCCVAGKKYPQYHCSPPIKRETKAHMTINSFRNGGDGGGPSECDNKYHSDSEMVVALSTGWYDHGSRCLKNIRINANGKSVLAKVVDECDSVNGCDSDHDFQPPCPNNIVDASPAVWKALGIPAAQIGDYDVTWSDA